MMYVYRSLLVCLVLLVDGFQCTLDIRLPPSIIHGPPKQKIYTSGEDVQLPCVATGSPKPMYGWMLRNRYLDLNEYRNIYMSQEDGTITIKDASIINEGEYQCFAMNDHGKAMSNIATMRGAFLASYPPNLRVSQYNVNAGEHVKISCQLLKTVPAATIRWFLASSARDNTSTALVLDKRINIDEDGHLHFAYVKTSDAQDGKLYRCTHFNTKLDRTVGGSDSRLSVHPGPTEQKRPRLVSSSADVKVGLVGGSMTLKCLFSGIPAPQVSWSRVNGEMPASRASWSKDSGTLLEIKNIQKSDEGEYKCQGMNSRGSEEHVMTIVTQSEPVFESSNKRPHNINATEGEDVSFTCDPIAVPDAEVLWYINGKKLNVNRPGPQRLISNDKKNLTVYNICKNCTSGNSLMNVQCTAKNKHGSIVADGYLNVLKPTVITLAPDDVVMVSGEKVVFKCEALSDDSTPVTIRWLADNGIEIRYIENHIWVNSMDNSLHIKAEDQGASYAGKYTCVASNMYSEARASALLTLPPARVREYLHYKSSVVPRSDNDFRILVHDYTL